MQFKIKNDEYRTARGTSSKIVDLLCRVCGEHIMVYQKDDYPGRLRRLYLDRIFFPKELTNLENKELDVIPVLQCPKCKEDLGTPYIYKSENRKAFKVYQDALVSKIRK